MKMRGSTLKVKFKPQGQISLNLTFGFELEGQPTHFMGIFGSAFYTTDDDSNEISVPILSVSNSSSILDSGYGWLIDRTPK